MKFKNYNSVESLSSYDLGEVCAFYLHNADMKNLTKASVANIQQYASVLAEAVENNPFVSGNGKWGAYTHLIGVIVKKNKASSTDNIDRITRMFKTEEDKYVLRQYAVGYKDIFTNNKELVPPAALLYKNTNK